MSTTNITSIFFFLNKASTTVVILAHEVMTLYNNSLTLDYSESMIH